MSSKILEAKEKSILLRETIGISKEEMFWFQVEVGCRFLENWFGWQAMDIATKTNFWDLFLMEWVYDDVEIDKRYALIVGVEHYKSIKLGRFDDRRFCELMYDLLERKT
ncbi:MAG: hypothetical protein ACOVQ4_07250 [Flectobacillus sp.]|uniref:hypothetical protein n=1 Tax=Flectobacillus sp. TaxID=50419 RepID=UPI003B9A9DEC